MLTPTILPAACAFTLHRCPNGTYETTDGEWVVYRKHSRWKVARRSPGVTVLHPRYDGFNTLRDARHMLLRTLTRYQYDAGQGEQCAVCGKPRGVDQMHLGWWWHTACRAQTDPEGAARLNGPPSQALHQQED